MMSRTSDDDDYTFRKSVTVLSQKPAHASSQFVFSMATAEDTTEKTDDSTGDVPKEDSKAEVEESTHGGVESDTHATEES